MKTDTKPKDKLFETATRLFYQHGYRAVGVDTIAAEAGIGKMTLYRYYPSKDDLIVAYLRDSNRTFWEQFEHITRESPDPRAKLLAFFESLQSYTLSPQCYGCPFINVATEYPEVDYVGHQVALEHKQGVLARFRELAEEAGAHSPDALAGALFLLMDGAYVAARMFGPSPTSPAAHLAETARQIIQAHS
jgi:AcrR family transcriptional regulator